MAMKNRGPKAPASGSIRRLLTFSNAVILLIMLLPSIVSVVAMLNYSRQYHRVITQVERAANLRPIVMEDIPDALFAIVAGRESFEDGRVFEAIDEINAQLDALISSQTIGSMELSVARRTMNTLEEYVSQMAELQADRAPVAESEVRLEEVRSVAALIGDMLQAYTTQEIASASMHSWNLRNTVTALTIASVGLIAAAGVASWVAHRRLSAAIHVPLQNLVNFAQEVADGDLQARVPDTTTEELVSLSVSLNTMAGKLQELIDQNRQEQENLKKSELRTLQAQITPHFLYNTLDAIIWLAEEKRSEEVIEITKALSDFFRISLSQGRDWISMEEEVRHLQGYLTIQKIRYRDILNYQIDVPETLLKCEVLKLLIQPLVENAIYHGVKNRRGGGMITVRVAGEENHMRISVRDTGPGMGEERLAQLRSALKNGVAESLDAPQDIGYGLLNVDKRIRLYYQQAEGIHIQSDEKGTLVYFCVPAQRRPSGV